MTEPLISQRMEGVVLVHRVYLALTFLNNYIYKPSLGLPVSLECDCG